MRQKDNKNYEKQNTEVRWQAEHVCAQLQKDDPQCRQILQKGDVHRQKGNGWSNNYKMGKQRRNIRKTHEDEQIVIALVLLALAFWINMDLWGHISTDAFLDIALWILFTIFHCYFFLPFIHPFYLFVYHFISSLITFPFHFSVDLHLQSLHFTFQAFHTCAPLHSAFSLIPCTHSINTSRHTCIFLS